MHIIFLVNNPIWVIKNKINYRNGVKRKMTRTELVKAVATATEMTQKDVKEVIDAAQAVTVETLASGEEVNVFEGLKLVVKDVAERQARNPQTGEVMVIPAHQTVKAKLGAAFKNIFA